MIDLYCFKHNEYISLILKSFIVTIIIFYNYCISFYLRCVLQTPYSVVTSPNGKWARCSPWWLPGCEGSRTKTTHSLLLFLLFLSADHGRVSTGNSPEPSRNRSHCTFTFFPPSVSLVTEPHLREPQARPSPLVCCWYLLVYWNALTEPHFPVPRALFSRSCSPLFCSEWKCRGATVATAAVFYYLKSRDTCVFTLRADCVQTERDYFHFLLISLSLGF